LIHLNLSQVVVRELQRINEDFVMIAEDLGLVDHLIGDGFRRSLGTEFKGSFDDLKYSGLDALVNQEAVVEFILGTGAGSAGYERDQEPHHFFVCSAAVLKNRSKHVFAGTLPTTATAPRLGQFPSRLDASLRLPARFDLLSPLPRNFLVVAFL